MSTITKKQAYIAVFAVVFATAMITGVVLANDAFAKKHHSSKHAHVSQTIAQGNTQSQSSSVSTSGTGSPVTASGINAQVANNTNSGGNAAAVDQSG